jgi:hypothetical protein
MLASRRMNINNYSKDLPNEITKLIEEYTEITFSITIDNSDDGMKVKLINVFNNEVLEEIYLDDAVDTKIKLSSDGTKLIYLDNNINMSYYDIKTKIKNKIELPLSSVTTENTKKKLFFDNGVPKFYYFDRNGLYFIIVGNQKTHLIDVMNRTVSDEFLFFAYNTIDENDVFSSDYKRVFLRTQNNYFYVIDFIIGDILYQDDIESNETCLACTDKNMNYIVTGNKTTKEIIIKDINNNNIIFNYNEYNIINIRGMIFEKNLLIMHFKNYIKIVNIKNNKITQIDNLTDNYDYSIIELIDEENIVINKNFNTIIEHIRI